ncbi:glycosyltransferase family 4 protein [Anoxynatronum buryatiense]|uniref:Glycosyltransferase involved in cell wall bisynthesis n=1 Tax=Anoxynatronum buryatiense TaxID=489973 RepID=A0AA46AI27_9CLOT|nr:glycosyltransferase family 4 protein [Anoxynatronum buryatiense]SMP45621.1 Glycosyltransferase involved in cell wall bisynthesis [Anoxynatronum buryatiense]
MKVAILSPIAWRTPPRHYGPWERVVSLLTEGLVRKKIDVTLFATGDSVTTAELRSVCPKPYEEDKNLDPKVWECLHISEIMEQAHEFDLIHNHFDFLPLSYSGLIKTPMVTTIHGFSSPKILPVFQKYNQRTDYVSISDADRNPALDYIRTVYHGIDLEHFTLKENPGEYLLYFGRIHPDKGTWEAIQVAQKTGMKLVIAGIIQDHEYYSKYVEPYLNEQITYIGSVGPEKRDNVLGHAYALLHPIHFNEPFGLSVVEAMACGTPVIAFGKGSMNEIIEQGINGFIASDVTEMIQQLKNISSIQRNQCRASVTKRFSQEIMVQGYLRVYEEILNR